MNEFYRDTENRPVLERLTAIGVVSDDGRPISTIGDEFTASLAGRELVLDGVSPNQSLYIYFGHISDSSHKVRLRPTDDNGGVLTAAHRTASPYDVLDERLFSFSVDRVTGGNMVFDVYPIVGRTVGRFLQGCWLKVNLQNDVTDAEHKVVLDINFSAKDNAVDPVTGQRLSNTTDATYLAGDSTSFRLTLWVKNTPLTGHDQEMDMGDAAVFTPSSYGENAILWGDNKAMLQFSATGDNDSFYLGLSTASDRDFYTQYAVPASAQLWFYDFLGRETIPANTYARLTLGYPWDEADLYRPEPENCFLYARSYTGDYVDVTDQFTLNTTGDFPGWTTTLRSLSSYCISDTDLSIPGASLLPTSNGGVFLSANPTALQNSSTDPILPNIKLPANTGFLSFVLPAKS